MTAKVNQIMTTEQRYAIVSFLIAPLTPGNKTKKTNY